MLHDKKSQDKKLNILRTKRAFEVKYEAFFIIFKELSVAKNYLRPESAPLKILQCEHCKIFKVCLAILQHERVNATYPAVLYSRP